MYPFQFMVQVCENTDTKKVVEQCAIKLFSNKESIKRYVHYKPHTHMSDMLSSIQFSQNDTADRNHNNFNNQSTVPDIAKYRLSKKKFTKSIESE
jgi:hypothetical protein